MPGARRTITRGPNSPTVTLTGRGRSVDGSSPCCDDDSNPLASLLTQPKHAHVPDVPTDSNLIFELMIFGFSVMCLCLQYINLYKTVWWLPQSHANYALNFYLIDPYLAGLLVVLMSRRVICCFIQDVCGGRSYHACIYWLLQGIKTVLIGSVVLVFVYTAYHVVLKHSVLYTLFLCYPLVTYVILFGINVKPLFSKTVNLTFDLQDDKNTPKHKVLDPYNKDLPVHFCSISPEVVRAEVEMLKTDFNDRIKQVLFNSMLCAYYMGLVPLLFAQNTLYYDAWWVGKHVCMVWISAFVLSMVHYLPSKYVDVLHRCALHLGRWVKVENRHAHVGLPYNPWSELQVWQQGALVKHVRGLFRAEGINNSAEPGNSMHTRFYFMFSQPLRVINWLLVIAWGLVICQFLTLIQVTDWSHIIALAFLLFSNYYALFKLMRDRFVLSRAYKEEQTSSLQ